MATVTQVCDYVCDVTGLSKTGAERTLVLRGVNDAHKQICDDVGLCPFAISYALTSGTADYNPQLFKPASGGFVTKLIDLTITGSGMTGVPLQITDPGDIANLRQATGVIGSQNPYKYALLSPNLIAMWPTPGAGVTLNGYGLEEPPDLVESGPTGYQESSPTEYPARFHYDSLGNLGIAYAYEYDNNSSSGADYRVKYAASLAKMTAWAAIFAPQAPFRRDTVSSLPYYPQRNLDG